jgi:hypothetical protein
MVFYPSFAVRNTETNPRFWQRTVGKSDFTFSIVESQALFLRKLELKRVFITGPAQGGFMLSRA